MSRKTGNKWKTNRCGRCGKPHTGYSGKLDKNNIEYVVCQCTNKRMNVSNDTNVGGKKASFFATIWTKE